MWVSMAFGWKKDPLCTMFKGEFPGGGVLPYISHTVCTAPSARVFGSFWSENGYGFRGNYGMYERICRFNSK